MENEYEPVNWELLAALSKPFPESAIAQREGAYGKQLDYVATETVIRRLNRVAGAWSFRRTAHEWTEPVSWTDRKTGEIRTSRTLIVFGEMTIPGLGTRSGTGVQIVEHKNGGEDMIKGGLSDCLKNCAKEFGVGIDLYGPDLEAGELPSNPKPSRSRPQSGGDQRPAAGGGQLATPRQFGMIRALAREHGITDAQLNEEIAASYGGTLDQLDRREASGFIERLQTRAAVNQEHPAPTAAPAATPVAKSAPAGDITFPNGKVLRAAQVESWKGSIGRALTNNALENIIETITNNFGSVPPVLMELIDARSAELDRR